MERGILVAFTFLMLLPLFAGTVSARDECRGRCYEDSGCEGALIEGNMTCSVCTDHVGGYWEPYENEDCFNTSSYALCLNYCVQCCDGMDNEPAPDGAIDYPADGECTCGLDPSESEELPPIPELSTFVLLSFGLLALAVLIWKRRKKE